MLRRILAGRAREEGRITAERQDADFLVSTPRDVSKKREAML